MKARILSVLIAAAAISGSAQAQLQNGDFEGGFTTTINGDIPDNWTFTPNGLSNLSRIVDRGGFPVGAYEPFTAGSTWVDLTGTLSAGGTGTNGAYGNSISQTFNFVAGPALLSFNMAATGFHDAAVEVTINGSSTTFVAAGLGDNSFVNTWATFNMPFTALAGSNTISFLGIDPSTLPPGPNVGSALSIGLDNISISSVTAVPEPSAYALALVGLGALGVMSRRRKRQG
jgi:hypothetical protein